MILDGILSFILYVLTFWIFIDVIYINFSEKLRGKGVSMYYGIALVVKRPFRPGAWRGLRKISAVWIILFIFALYFFYNAMLSNIVVKYVVHSSMTPVQLLIPGINITGIDLLFFAVSVLVAAVVHELSHAYTARSFGLSTKNIGFAILFFLPIAFVEVDEKELGEAPLKAKVSVLSAGPASNFALALLAMILIPLIINPYGLLVVRVVPGSLADKYGLHENTVILAVNNSIATLNRLHEYLAINRSTTIILTIIEPNGRSRNIAINKPANVTRLGVYLQQPPSLALINTFGVMGAILLMKLIVWFYIVNASLAVLNAAPIFISDGGRIVYEVLRNKNFGHIINAATLLIMIIALAPAP